MAARAQTQTRPRSDAQNEKEPGAQEVKSAWKHGGRREAFRKLAEREAAGEPAVPPHRLTGQARREHVRAVQREDHAGRIKQKDPGAAQKFDELAGDSLKFFRGTALLFYRDMAGEDADMPTVMALGDVHPGKFGIMPDRHGAPIFSVNDFDEAIYAPFTWGLKRGAVGVWTAAREEGGLARKKRAKNIRKFAKGYLKAMAGSARTDDAQIAQARIGPAVT
ncbi:MAG: DUF2252 family protein [Oceanicaulis sp.]